MRDSSTHGRVAEATATRRGVLGAAGAAGVAALAGCTGGSGGDGGADGTLTVPTGVAPGDMEWNEYADINYPDRAGFVVFDRLLYYRKTTGEFVPGALSEWDVGDDVATLTLADGVRWHDGTEATAADLERKLAIEAIESGPISEFASDGTIEAVDDRRLEIGLERTVSEPVFLNSLLMVELDTPATHYEDALAALRDDPETDALEEIRIDEPVGTGPFRFERAAEQELVLSKFEDYHRAENVNFEEMRYQFLESNSQRWQAMRGETVDALHNVATTPEVAGTFPDHVREIKQPANWGMSILFDHEHEHFGRLEVRQAIAHLIDREAVAANSAAGGDWKASVKTPHGIAGNFDGGAEDWLDDPSAYEDYGPGARNTERAAELLESAGFSREDGSWVDEDGQPLEFSIKVPSDWDDWVRAVTTYNQHLSDFGIDAELVSRSESAFFDEDLYGDAGFDVTVMWWVEGVTYPYHSFRWIFNSQEADTIWNLPDEAEIPPIGEPDGPTETMVFADEIGELVAMDPESDEAREKIQRLAWAVNYWLPMLPLMEKFDQSFVSTDGWDVVEESDPDASVQYPTTYLPRVGKLTAETE